MFDNNLREIRKIIYNLKRQFGLPIIIRSPLSSTNNLETGKSTRTYTSYTIRRAIILTSTEIRDLAYDLAYIAANKNFTYGGFFDLTERTVIIDAKDLPTDFRLSLNDHLIFQTRQYEIMEVCEAEHHMSYLLHVKELQSSDTVT